MKGKFLWYHAWYFYVESSHCTYCILTQFLMHYYLLQNAGMAIGCSGNFPQGNGIQRGKN